MKFIIKTSLFSIAVAMAIVSCKKDDDSFNAAADQTNNAAATFSLNNRVIAGFVIDSSTLANLPAGSLPAKYNSFRKQLTYDTISSANKPKLYSVGDTIVVLGYVQGDDAAIAKRSINFKFFGIPTAFSNATPVNRWVKSVSNPPISPIQSAEDSIRGFAPRTIDVLSTVSFSSITETTSDTLTIKKVATNQVNGINASTYLVSLNYIIPQQLSGVLTSINFAVGTGNLRNDLGNVNWNYAFKVR